LICVNLYEEACKWHESAKTLLDNDFYQQCIYHACMASELYLKSALNLVEHDPDMEISHDILGMFLALSKRYGKSPELLDAVKRLRKYFNEARYPSMTISFTKELAVEFLDYAVEIRDFVDNCTGTLEDLAKHFNKKL